MTKTFVDALKHRRTYYAIKNESPVSDEKIEEIINTVVTHTPSAFNSQSSRVVLLLGENHKKMWNITKDILHKIMTQEAFVSTEAKIDNAFLAGYGTVLFFEDEEVVRGLQQSFPLYASNFPLWSYQTSAMHQLAIWTMLEDEGFGANLQHYNPLIDDEIAKEWNLPRTWKLIAQMPFGMPAGEPGEKTFKPLEDRIKIFK